MRTPERDADAAAQADADAVPTGGADAASARESVEAAHRAHWGSVLAATLGLTRDLDLAEDSAQEAFAQALTAWPREGVPHNPGGWLTTTARRRALDTMRRGETLQRKLPLLVWDEAGPEEPEPAGESKGPDEPDGADGEDGDDGDDAPAARIQDEERAVVLDEQLRLIFLAAHPALAPSSRIALTLRLVGGMPTADIAAAFLVSESTMAARLTRAKKRIRVSRIPCRVPGPAEMPGRLVDVLDVLSVLLAAGGAETGDGAGTTDGASTADGTAPGGATAVVDAAVRMLETLVQLLPGSTEPQGLLAQALALRARVATRADAEGRPVALMDQDRTRWDSDLLARADGLVIDGLARGGRGPYLIQGAIAAAVAVPSRHEDVDWGEVVELYDALLEHWPTAIVRLGRAVALAEAEGAGAALDELAPLAAELDAHRPFHVIRGELLGRLGRHEEASRAYREALALPGTAGQTRLLEDMIR
jgi:RNA polymerase sigma-70 factor (ECF subfamily)